MGSKTYSQVLSFGKWPYVGKPTWVLTKRAPNHKPDLNIEFSSKEPILIVRHIKNKSKKDIWLVGGGQVISSFINQNLIDTIILFIIPILLGNGIPLFKNLTPLLKLNLLNEQRYNNGVIKLEYEISHF